MTAIGRASASVVVPFAGRQAQLEEMLARLGRVDLRPGDEAILVDNRRDAQAPREPLAPGIRVLHAPDWASSWHAREVGAAASGGEWIVFIDADTRPEPALLERYLDPPPGPGVAVLAGAIRDWSTAASACSRYVSARAKMDQAQTLGHPYRPYAQTANCAVRRLAFERAGGFALGAGSSAAGDADLCWRLQDAGWLLESRPAAAVDHENRVRFRDLYGQLARHGAGLAWLEQRYPGSAPRPRPRELVGRVPHYLARAAAADREERLFTLADLCCLYARDIGRVRAQDLTAKRR